MAKHISMNKTGKVYLIGAGPGDEGLFTIKGMECLKTADTVIYDNLINPSLLKNCKAGAELIFVGKMASNHTLTQDEINQLLIDKAKEGKNIARMKGGDPLVFGRGSEEAMELKNNGIEFEFVPGVTSGIAAPCYAGIPFTHRGFTATAAFITGHEDPNKEDTDINWEKLATACGTLVFYMGVKNLPNIVEQLTKNGRSPQTPVALVRRGTYNHQETYTGTLENIVEVAKTNNVKPPVITIVGEVVSLREELRWFDKRPLFGRRTLVTRSRTQASELKLKLENLGADVIEFPTIDIQPVKDLSVLDVHLKALSTFTWVVFTSVNAVDIFFKRLFEIGLDSRALFGVKVAVIGEETGITLKKYGVQHDLVPEKYTSESTVAALLKVKQDFSTDKVLLPTSAIARDVISTELKKRGAQIVSVTVYDNFVPGYTTEEMDKIFSQVPELITFTSSSTVTNLVEILKIHGKENLLSQIKGASIGPVTSDTLKQNNIQIALEAEVHTIEGLVNAINQYYITHKAQ